ncbi:Scavenger receptor class B member 1 [Echinococcus granulosus]|uniref:CD36 class B scavenger receptor n=1 Tax=Echinococcus granulosus TaxID=6210 RepID=A0A068WFP5_ECHGR|nr:Scavenger receptor class B member 1 [Echinococcus granulosus]CDS18582.1 CD36 class B scavenger receptor [Echinococcus granulosus]
MACVNCSKKAAIVVGAVTAITLLITVLLLTLFGTFDRLVDHMVHANIIITPTSSVYSNWVSPDTPIYFSIYLFNVTNYKDVVKGAKPRLKEIGPYVYMEKREKTNITWPKGDHSQVSFYQRLTFTLNRNLSAGDPDNDIVVGISIPLVTLSANAEAGNGPSSTEYAFLTILMDLKVFINTTVTEFLWGYEDPVTEACNALDSRRCPSNKVGLMFGKNGTDDGPFVIDTGASDITQLGNILSYKGKSVLDVWSSDEANQIKGTDGSHLAPDVSMNSRRFIFAADLCRSFELKVDGPGKLTNSDKLKVLSMGGTPETAEPASVNPANKGYCPPKTAGPPCPPAGIFDLSSCRRQNELRPPIYSSQPYFFGADPTVREGVEGLPTPTADNASTKIFVEPKLGLVLEAYKRLQISVYVRPSRMMSDEFKNWTRPTFLPVVWFEEKAVAEADALETLYNSVYVQPNYGRRIVLIAMSVFVGLLFILLVTLTILLFKICRHNRRTGDAIKSGAVSSPAVGLFDAKYTKVTA